MKRFWRYLLPLALLTAEDKDRLAYIIPRLSVSEENEYFYVIPVIWDFWVNKRANLRALSGLGRYPDTV